MTETESKGLLASPRSRGPAGSRGRVLLAALLVLAAGAGSGTPRAGADGPAAPDAVAPALRALLDRTLGPSERADLAFLEHLGWRLTSDAAVRTVTVAGGSPCQREDLAQAHAAGDLTIRFPAGVAAEEVKRFGGTLAEIIDSPASRCAWQLKVAPAAERAAARLSENAKRGNYTFPKWLVVDSPFFNLEAPESAWVRRGRIYYARRSPSEAIEAFYTEKAVAECYVAQVVATFAVQYETYGRALFEQAFKPEEIAIADVEPFHDTAFGKWMDTPPGYPWRALFLRPEDDGKDEGLVLARIGPKALVGVTGILMDQNQTGRSNENFMIVSASDAAAKSLVAHGGFAYVAEGTQRLLSLGKASRVPFVTGAEMSAYEAEMAAILADPAFSEVRLYIHPYGIVTLGEMADRKRRKDQTAVAVYTYTEAREDAFYKRYREAFRARFERANSTARTR